MRSNFSRAWEIFRGRQKGRSVQVFDDDVFIVSYPKSGNTWTRFLIANLISGSNDINFNNVNGIIPDIYINQDRTLTKQKSPRFLKSHEYFNPEYKKVIYIVRDPRDVVVSYYLYSIKRNFIKKNVALHEFLETFLQGKVDCFGSWRENVGGWLGAREGAEDFLFLRYEDMLSDTLTELIKISGFLSMDKSLKELNGCIEKSSFDNMRKLELQNDFESVKSQKSEGLYFVRSGKSGGWRDVMEKKDSDLIESKWGELMRKIGYL